jgi:Right handed beta helix region
MLCRVRDLPGRGGQRRVRRALVLLGTAAAVTVWVTVATASGSGRSCSAWASPRGADANPGTRARPYRSVGRLANSLKPGRRGCLEAGYVFDQRVVLHVSGAPHAPITISSGPGGRAVLARGIELASSARYVHLENLTVRARPGTPSAFATVVVRGYAIYFEDSDVSAGAGVDVPRTCVLLDHAGGAVIEGNTIHHCGGGLNYASGINANISVNARISDNTVYANPGDGLALSPDAQRTFVTRNLFVENEAGVYFGGAARFASRDNRVLRNVVTQSRRYAVHGSYKEGLPVGRRNLVLDNCLWQTARLGGTGYMAARNRVVDPRVISIGGSYRLGPGSPCRGYGAGV